MCFDLTKVATTFKLDFLFLAASPRGSRRPLVNAVSRGKPTVTFLSNDRPNLHYLKSNDRRIRYRSVRRRVALGRYRVAGAILTFETVLEKISCRRKLLNTTGKHQEDDAQYQVCGLASEALALRINPHAIACGYF